MKFLEIMGYVDNSSYIRFKFSLHDRDDVCLGDKLWSDGQNVEVSDFIDDDDLEYLLSFVENKRAFRGALMRMGFDV